jgi:hypothetical protein
VEKTQKKFEKAQLENINFLNFIFLCFLRRIRIRIRWMKWCFVLQMSQKMLLKLCFWAFT